MRPIVCLLVLAAASAEAAPRRPHVVFVIGDHEYSSEETMPLLAAELERRHGLKTTVVRAVPDQNAEANIPGLEALGRADLAIFFLRWRRLPPEQLAHIEAYLKTGKPVIGFRTSSHAFNYPKGDPLERWNAFGAEAFGTPPGWGADGHTHCGHACSTDVTVIPGAARHPVLTGIKGPFHVRSWLYVTVPTWPPPDAKPLLLGRAVDPEKPVPENPVAWTWTNRYRARAFFTSLGHPEDFQAEPVQRLVLNAVYWALGRPVAKRWKGPFKMDVPYRGARKIL